MPKAYLSYYAIILLSGTPSPNPVALQHFQSVQNECYGVLQGGGVPQTIELNDNAAYSSVLQEGGVPQSIELKDNAAYSSVLQTQSAPHSQSIVVNDNVAYGKTSENNDLSYDYI